MRLWLGFFALLTFLPSSHAAPDPQPTHPLPWADGEKLTYTVDWGLLHAAEGIFEAHDQGDQWKFVLTLQSQGPVQLLYPLIDSFTSQTTKDPWRSIAYTEDRQEPNHVWTDETHLNYAAQTGQRVITTKIPSNKLPEIHAIAYTHDSLDDIGSMLYRLRAGSWKQGDKRTLYVYESNSEKEGNIECVSQERRAFGTWPEQPMLKIVALPGKGTHRKGGLVLWMTDDSRRLVLHADLLFKYGSFTVDLLKVENLRTGP